MIPGPRRTLQLLFFAWAFALTPRMLWASYPPWADWTLIGVWLGLAALMLAARLYYGPPDEQRARPRPGPHE